MTAWLLRTQRKRKSAQSTWRSHSLSTSRKALTRAMLRQSGAPEGGDWRCSTGHQRAHVCEYDYTPHTGECYRGPASQQSEILGAVTKIRKRKFPIVGRWDEESMPPLTKARVEGICECQKLESWELGVTG